MRPRLLLAASTIVATFGGGCVMTRERLVDRQASPANGESVVLSGGGAGACVHGSSFSAAMLVPGFEGTDVISARLSPNETTIYISTPQTAGVPANFDLFVATRASSSDPFGTPTAFSLSTSTDDYWPSPSGDGLSMFYESGRQVDAGPAYSRIWYATRASLGDAFATASNGFFDGIGPTVFDSAPYLLPSATALYWTSLGRSGSSSQDIWSGEVSSTGAISNAQRVTEVSTTNFAEQFPVASDDNLELFFARYDGNDDAYVVTRASSTGPWRRPAKVTGDAAINTTDAEWPAWISPDACRLYFVRTGGGADGGFQSRLWVASRTPGEVVPTSDVSCTTQITNEACGGGCVSSPRSVSEANVPVRIRALTDEYAIGGAGDSAYLTAGGARHAIELDALDVFTAFWSSGSLFSLAGDPPAEAFQPDLGSPPEVRTTVAGGITVTNAVETTVSLRAVRWPVKRTLSSNQCSPDCLKYTLDCTGTAIAER